MPGILELVALGGWLLVDPPAPGALAQILGGGTCRQLGLPGLALGSVEIAVCLSPGRLGWGWLWPLEPVLVTQHCCGGLGPFCSERSLRPGLGLSSC